MGAKRFKGKKVEVKSLEDKEKSEQERKELKNKPNLKIVESNKVSNHLKNEILSSVKSTGDHASIDRQLTCYHKINDLFQNNSLNLINLMKGVLEIVCVGVEAEGGSLWIHDEQRNKLACKVANGPGCEKVTGMEVESNQGIVGWVFENKKSTIVYDASVDERFIGKKTFGTKSLVASPLLYNNEVIGVLQVVNKTTDTPYTDSCESFLDDLATVVAMHIKTSRVIKEQASVMKRMNTFAELHEKFSSTIELEKLIPMVLHRAIELLNAEVGSVWLVEDNGEGNICAYADGPTKSKVEGLKLKSGVGLIGDIIENKQSVIVEDCSKDERFNKAMDDKIKFETRSMVSAPFIVKGECIGAIQIINKRGNKYFDQEDLDLLALFASSSAMYIKNAKLFSAEKKAKDLSALIEIGNQITSTLDLDAVLFSIVNLSSQVIPFDEASISSIERVGSDKASLRAISGQHEVDLLVDKYKTLQHIHHQFSQTDETVVYFENREKAKDYKLVPELYDYLEKNEIESFWVHILKDDQGVVGVFSLESEELGFIKDNISELLSILSSQSTVAMRNAELYNTIPSGQLMKNVSADIMLKIKNIREMPREVAKKIVVATAAILICLVVVKVPYQVSANVEILPQSSIYYAETNGKISKMHVREGQPVKKGDLLAEIDTEDTILELKQKEFSKQKARTEMMKLRGEGKIAEYKIKEAEYLSADYEVQLLDRKIKNSKIHSSVTGVVISENLEELIGKPVTFGDEVIKVANHENLLVAFDVPEAEVNYVRPDQEVKFKVYGHPTESFGENIALRSIAGEGRQVLDADPNKYYKAKAKFALNAETSLLKPGMTGRGKIYADWQPLGHVLFSKIYHFIVMEILF